MTPEAQRIAIAEATGDWKNCRIIKGQHGDWDEVVGTALIVDGTWADSEDPVPLYESDLNAMHEAVGGLSGHDMEIYANHLARLSYGKGTCGIEWHGKFSSLAVFDMLRASAEIQAEALLRTLNRWKE